MREVFAAILLPIVPLLMYAQTANHDLPAKIGIPYYAVGVIWDADANIPIGSGFVFKNPNTVITARHVLVTKLGSYRHLVFRPVKGIVEAQVPSLNLSPVSDDRKADIAVLRIDGQSPCPRGLLPSTSPLRVDDMALYGGFDTRERLAVTFSMTAQRIVRVYEENGVEFFELKGDARPGYSGGPLFGRGEEVIGIILRGAMSSDGQHSIFDAVSIKHVPAIE